MEITTTYSCTFRLNSYKFRRLRLNITQACTLATAIIQVPALEQEWGGKFSLNNVGLHFFLTCHIGNNKYIFQKPV